MQGQNPILQIKASGIGQAAQTLQQFQLFVRECLERLRVIDRRFASLSLLGQDAFEPISDDLSDLEARVLRAVSESEWKRSRTSALGPQFVSEYGFSLVFFSRSSDHYNSHISLAHGGFELAIDGVSSASGGGISLKFQSSFYGSESLEERVEQIVQVMMEVWPYRVVSVREQDFERAVQQPGDIYSGKWKLFLPFTELGQCLPSEVKSKRFCGGTMITTTLHIPVASNPSDVAAGKRVREALDRLGLVWHSTYAIHGWPPDEEEWRYEEFISGAPRGRKYRVRCIDFDGYDAQRNVLLYAKLFRRLRAQRKEWGLRGWDGPVLNEARRQVRAANGTQIEWHIGLEEPAARVRTLLADYTDFKEEQLRVVYTPVSQMASR